MRPTPELPLSIHIGARYRATCRALCDRATPCARPFPPARNPQVRHFLSLSGPAAAIPGPRAGRREAPAAAAARRIPPSPHPPRVAASRIHPSSPHRRISPTRMGGQPRPQQDPRNLCPPPRSATPYLQVCNFFSCSFLLICSI